MKNFAGKNEFNNCRNAIKEVDDKHKYFYKVIGSEYDSIYTNQYKFYEENKNEFINDCKVVSFENNSIVNEFIEAKELLKEGNLKNIDNYIGILEDIFEEQMIDKGSPIVKYLSNKYEDDAELLKITIDDFVAACESFQEFFDVLAECEQKIDEVIEDMKKVYEEVKNSFDNGNWNIENTQVEFNTELKRMNYKKRLMYRLSKII